MAERLQTPPPSSSRRDQSRVEGPFLASGPTLSLDDEPHTPTSATSSPRAAVANRFSDMSLTTLDLKNKPAFSLPSPRKRGRSLSSESDHELSDSQAAISTACVEKPQSLAAAPDSDMAEVPGGLQAQHRGHSETQGDHLRPNISAQPRRRRSPKPRLRRKPRPVLSSGTSSASPPVTPMASHDASFWTDDEITGHLMDDADDDGYGINGIGFRPTAAVAFARSQKRQQQISDWRARESKEARQLRSHRRRRGPGQDARVPTSYEGNSGPEQDARMMPGSGYEGNSGSEMSHGPGANKKDTAHRSVRFA